MTWLAASLLILAVGLGGGFAWYERSQPGARMLALVAALAALAALGRVAFAPLPNVKPTTDIVLLAGYVLGGAPGFAVGAVAAIASNLFFGQGPWTPWQMAAWGLVGLFGAGLARVAGRDLGRVPLAVAASLAGLGFGAIMNVSLFVTYGGGHELSRLVAYFVTSLPFDLAHAIGNVVFCLAFGPALVVALRRYRTRSEVHWSPLPDGRAVAALLLALVTVAAVAGALAAPGRAEAAGSPAGYLLRAQNADGGWGSAPGQRSNGLYSGAAALGLAASGRSPGRVARRASALAYTRAHLSRRGDLGALERDVMVLAAGRSSLARGAAGSLARRARSDGSFAGRVNTTAFGVLALRSAGRSARDRTVRRATAWVARQANGDGGFNFAGRGGPSGIDDTAAALMALRAGGRSAESQLVRRGAAWIAARQGADGGFPLSPGQSSNAQSTAWAVQALVAIGRNPSAVRRGSGRDPLSYLRSLTTSTGAVRYSRTSAQTPVWVTGQALMALERKPFPLR